MKNGYTVAAVLATNLFLAGTAALAASNEAIKRNNFGAELVKQDRLDEAVNEFQSAILADPRYAAAHLNLAFTYDRLGRADEAILAYKKAAELDPSNGTVLNNLGVLYIKKEMYDQAISVLEQGLKVDQANPTLQKNLEIAKKNRDNLTERDARIANARKQAAAQPKDPRAAYNVARLYAAFDMPVPALEWLGKAPATGLRRSPVRARGSGDGGSPDRPPVHTAPGKPLTGQRAFSRSISEAFTSARNRARCSARSLYIRSGCHCTAIVKASPGPSIPSTIPSSTLSAPTTKPGARSLTN